MPIGSVVALADSLRTLSSGSITGSFTALGLPFSHSMRLIKFVNTCNTDMFISYDGINNHDYIPAGSYAVYDLSTNQDSVGYGWFMASGTQVYVKQAAAPASGAVYLIAMYGFGE